MKKNKSTDLTALLPRARSGDRGSPAGHRHCFPAFGAETGWTGKKSLPADGSGQPAGAGAPGSHPEIPRRRPQTVPRFRKYPSALPAFPLHPEADTLEQSEGENLCAESGDELHGRFYHADTKGGTSEGAPMSYPCRTPSCMSCHRQRNPLEIHRKRIWMPCLQSVWTLSKGSSENEKENGEQWHRGEIGKRAERDGRGEWSIAMP